ncbi:hypothetical protein L1987_53320 [Smallanthus sonchifolius]|uniref:Uncharacterized protein n=1 Tax=Smallanthus sonchifolius TaxID=185202 RepID=A0ACB9EUY0_9ASTR|nr:hypothetical protein L1987_53320 [Smallanthus sonchifolius]
MTHFEASCRARCDKPNVSLFRRFYRLHVDGSWLTFEKRRGSGYCFSRFPTCIHEWKDHFLFVSNDFLSEPFPVRIFRNQLTTRILVPLSKEMLVSKILDKAGVSRAVIPSVPDADDLSSLGDAVEVVSESDSDDSRPLATIRKRKLSQSADPSPEKVGLKSRLRSASKRLQVHGTDSLSPDARKRSTASVTLDTSPCFEFGISDGLSLDLSLSGATIPDSSFMFLSLGSSRLSSTPSVPIVLQLPIISYPLLLFLPVLGSMYPVLLPIRGKVLHLLPLRILSLIASPTPMCVLGNICLGVGMRRKLMSLHTTLSKSRSLSARLQDELAEEKQSKLVLIKAHGDAVEEAGREEVRCLKEKAAGEARDWAEAKDILEHDLCQARSEIARIADDRRILQKEFESVLSSNDKLWGEWEWLITQGFKLVYDLVRNNNEYMVLLGEFSQACMAAGYHNGLVAGNQYAADGVPVEEVPNYAPHAEQYM